MPLEFRSGEVSLWGAVLADAIATWAALHPEYAADASKAQHRLWREADMWLFADPQDITFALCLQATDKPADLVRTAAARLAGGVGASTVADRLSLIGAPWGTSWTIKYTNQKIGRWNERAKYSKCRVCGRKRGEVNLVGNLCKTCYNRVRLNTSPEAKAKDKAHRLVSARARRARLNATRPGFMKEKDRQARQRAKEKKLLANAAYRLLKEAQ